MLKEKSRSLRARPAALIACVGFGALGLSAGMGAAVRTLPESDPSLREIRSLLASRCFRCHGPIRQDAGLNLARFTGAAAQRDPKSWRAIAARVGAGEMPPAGQPALSAAQRALITAWVRRSLESGDRGGAAGPDPGPTPVRRLTRSEYDRTILGLVGISFDSREAVGAPEDQVGSGLDNLAAVLNTSPTLMEKYVLAADSILDRITVGPNGKVPDIGDRNQAQKAHDTLFFVRPGKEISAQEAARKILRRFSRLAWRRPAQEREVDRLVRLYELAAARGEPFENALRAPLKAVLLSPYFLFRVEGDNGGGPNECAPVDDHALAVRLSYFLWSSMPDDRLFDLADRKLLSNPATLEQETRRMLSDPKARAFTDNFATQWLQIRKLTEARPSTDFFPTFTTSLREAMYDEATTFFDMLRQEDRSILDLLDSDYTYINEELAKHYNLPNVAGKQTRLVRLKPEDHRGGLLGMGAVLALTSHTYRTSPTLRGKWILDVLFGTPPPPPPPGVSVIEDEQKKQKSGETFRELLAQHARRPACAGCHSKMDPLGFALESYDAIGRWRTDLGGKPLDTSAQLPTGEKLQGAQELKRLVVRRQEAFVRNMAERTLSYAIGRELVATDEPTVAQINADLKKNDHRFSALIRAVVKSVPFQYHRNPPAPAAIGAPAAARKTNRSSVNPAVMKRRSGQR